MNSMTGYGRCSIDYEGRTLLIEFKSVNHRFLDLNIKMPRAHNFIESIIRKKLQNYFSRGHIDVYVTYTDNRDKKKVISEDEEIAGAYIKIANSLSQKYSISNDLSVTSLIRIPDVVNETYIEDDEEIITNMYLECLKGCANKLKEMRKLEGSSIQKELLERINSIKNSLDRINTRAPLVFQDYRIKLYKRINEALNDVAIDEARLVNEVAFYTDKCAIDEEISRLYTHIDSFVSLARANEPIGRKLDFIVQEMNREANTISSKANDIEIVNEVLFVKSEIEKIREQVQNIE